MTAREALRRAEAAGIRVFLRSNGDVYVRPTPSPALLADLRAHKPVIAAVLAAAARSPDLPTCPGCQTRWFWRSMTDGAVGAWTCQRVPIPAGVTQVDIIGPNRGEPAIVVCCTPGDVADPERFVRLVATAGAYVALGRIKPLSCRILSDAAEHGS